MYYNCSTWRAPCTIPTFDCYLSHVSQPAMHHPYFFVPVLSGHSRKRPYFVQNPHLRWSWARLRAVQYSSRAALKRGHVTIHADVRAAAVRAGAARLAGLVFFRVSAGGSYCSVVVLQLSLQPLSQAALSSSIARP